MPSTRIMLDLETIGTQPGSAIVSIGAVKFGCTGITDEFYERIDLQSCVDAGLEIDAETVLWWLKREDAARLELTLPAKPLHEVFLAFSAWTEDPECEIWGNGATFDNTLLAAAYHAAKLPRPWKYRNDRCYRTVAAMHPKIQIIRTGTHHHALDDARSQALHLIKVLSQSPQS